MPLETLCGCSPAHTPHHTTRRVPLMAWLFAVAELDTVTCAHACGHGYPSSNVLLISMSQPLDRGSGGGGGVRREEGEGLAVWRGRCWNWTLSIPVKKKKKKKIVLNVHRKHRAYQGRGEGGGKG